VLKLRSKLPDASERPVASHGLLHGCEEPLLHDPAGVCGVERVNEAVLEERRNVLDTSSFT